MIEITPCLIRHRSTICAPVLSRRISVFVADDPAKSRILVERRAKTDNKINNSQT